MQPGKMRGAGDEEDDSGDGVGGDAGSTGYDGAGYPAVPENAVHVGRAEQEGSRRLLKSNLRNKIDAGFSRGICPLGKMTVAHGTCTPPVR